MQAFDQTVEQALAWHQAGKGAVLATVTQTWGSAPRRVGSLLAISGEGEIEGSVSGGCVEGAVILEAQDVLETQELRELEFGVSDDDAFAVGLACGGTIRILLEPVGSVFPEEMLLSLCNARAAGQAIATVVDLESKERALTTDIDPSRFRRDQSGFEEESRRFITVHNPPLRLFVVGAVHIAQALVPMAKIAGYDPVVIDPRETFASSARFPETEISHDWPDEAIAAYGLNGRCAVVLLTHDPKLDDPALLAALASDCFYIGALGSKRTHAKRVERLEAQGISAEDIARIHGPIGLDIGASNPAEIAVSIISEMTQTLRKPA